MASAYVPKGKRCKQCSYPIVVVEGRNEVRIFCVNKSCKNHVGIEINTVLDLGDVDWIKEFIE